MSRFDIVHEPKNVLIRAFTLNVSISQDRNSYLLKLVYVSTCACLGLTLPGLSLLHLKKTLRT